MAGLPKKYAKMGFAKGWKAYRASKRKTSGGTRKQAKRAALPLLPKPKGKSMAKRRRRTAAKRTARRVTRRARAMVATRPAQMLMGAAVATAGGVGSSMVINNAPVIKDMDKGVKSFGQIAAGMATVMMLRNPLLRAAGAGAIVAGTMAAAKHFLKVEPLAGGDQPSTLSPYQLTAMVEEMQGTRRLGRPVDYSMRLGRPVEYQGAGSLSGGWKRDSWG